MNIKRIISVLTLCTLLSGGQIVSNAENKNSEAVERIKSLNIMTGYEDGRFGEAEHLTRAEFAAVICRILRLDDLSHLDDTLQYTDVPEDFWGWSGINVVSSIKYMQGYGNNMFGPDEKVTYNQVVTVMIKLLGYDSTCEVVGGDDYSPYINRAHSLGILKNVSFKGDEPITREELALVISNALDTKLMIIDTDGKLAVSDYTLFDRFRKDGEELEGIVQETSQTYLVEDNELDDDEVIINGVRYNVGDTDIRDYLGMNVHFFVQSVNDDFYVIKGFYPDYDNETLSLSGEDVIQYDNGYLTYENDERKEKRIKLSGCQFVCNGRIYFGAPSELLLSPNAKIKFINNDKDTEYEYAFVELYELAQILKNNTVVGSVYLQSTLKNGSRSIDYTDEDVNFTFLNTAGKEISPEELSAEDAWLEIYASRDGKNMKVILLDDAKSGYVERIDFNENGTVVIDGAEYALAKDYAGFLVSPKILVINEYYDFCVDSYGKIICVETKNENAKARYGYIYFVSEASDNSDDEPMKIKIINGTTVRNCKENEKYYIYGNNRQEIQTLELASKVRIDNVYYSEADDISRILKTTYVSSTDGKTNLGNVIKYTLNNEKRVNKIEIMESYGKYTARKLNAEQKVMGGGDTPFGIDEETVVFFIPKSGMEEDISCEMKFTTDSYKSAGYELDEETYTVSAVVFESPLSVFDNSDFSESERTKIIQAVSQEIDDDGEIVYRVSGYAGNEVFNRITRSGIENIESIVSDLKRGDVVQFQTDFDGQINRIKKSFSMEENEDFYHQGAQTSHEIIYGIAMSGSENYLGVGDTEYMNRLSIALDESGMDEATFLMPVKESTAPDIYVYYSDEKMVYPGDFDDIITMNEVGSELASRVILYACNAVVKSVLIIK